MLFNFFSQIFWLFVVCLYVHPSIRPFLVVVVVVVASLFVVRYMFF